MSPRSLKVNYSLAPKGVSESFCDARYNVRDALTLQAVQDLQAEIDRDIMKAMGIPEEPVWLGALPVYRTDPNVPQARRPM